MNDSNESAHRHWRACPVCNFEGGDPHWIKGSLRIVRCSRCGMIFANPVEARYVQGSFYGDIAEPFYLSPDKLGGDYAAVRFARELRLFTRHCQQGTVLDVGCSTGAFLHQLTSRHPGRYAVLGTDVAGGALDYAASRGVPVLRSSFLEHDFGGQRFDAVTFWAVMEHLAEPRRFLAKAASVLRPGGHLFILVPNLRSLAHRCLGPRYRYVMAEHLNYFAVDTLNRFVGRTADWTVVTNRSTHFNPAVLWQDWRRPRDRVPDAERAALLKRTTRWKQSTLLWPAQLVHGMAERVLGAFKLADNLVLIARRN